MNLCVAFELNFMLKEDGGSVEEETPSSDQTSAGSMGCHQQQKQQQHYHKTPVIGSSPHQTKRTLKEKVGQQYSHQDKYAQLVHSDDALMWHPELEVMILFRNKELQFLITEVFWSTEVMIALLNSLFYVQEFVIMNH